MSDLHPLGNTLLRTPETFAKYHDNPKRHSSDCFICVAPGRGDITRYWKLIENEFPYDAVAEKHLLLVPTRHFATEAEMTLAEAFSLKEAKEKIENDSKFDAIIENLARGRTFMPHYHLHLIQWKRS